MNPKKRNIIAGIGIAAFILISLGLLQNFGHLMKKNSGFNQNGKAGLETEEKTKSSEKESNTESAPKQERVIVENTDYDSIDNC